MDKLKPCPFCGDKEPLKALEDVWCTSCDVSIAERRWQSRPIEDTHRKLMQEAASILSVVQMIGFATSPNHAIWTAVKMIEPLIKKLEAQDG